MGTLNNYLFIKQGARQPVFTATLYDADGVTPLDLSLATGAKFRMRLETGTTLVINNAAATLSGALNSSLEYDWLSADTSTPGRYLAEAEIDFSLGSPLVVPVTGYWHIVVQPTLP